MSALLSSPENQETGIVDSRVGCWGIEDAAFDDLRVGTGPFEEGFEA